MRDKTELIKRYTFFVLGILTNSIGVAFITRSNLGTGPTTCIPYIVSLEMAQINIPLSYGICNFIFNAILLGLQVLILRKKFQKFQLLQLPVALVFSLLIDGAMFLTRNLPVDHYWLCIIWTVAGCVFRAVGVSFQVLADVVMLSTEAFVKAVSDSIRKEFSVCKLISDALMVGIAIGLSFLFFGKLDAVREGTIITVILVGPVSSYFTKRLGFTSHYFETDGEFVYETKLKLVEGKRLVVTITSEAGSGGRVIARILGTLLGIPVYDKELIDLVAEQGHFASAFVKAHDEKLYVNPAEAFFLENYSFGGRKIESYRKLYKAQCDVITNLAQTQDCIIVGHCSNFVLKDIPEAVHIFITTDMNHRIEYIKEKYRITERHAKMKIKKQDLDTFNYYQHFTGNNWKAADFYDMTINSALFGYEGTAEMLEQLVKKSYIETPKVKIRELIKKYQTKK